MTAATTNFFSTVRMCSLEMISQCTTKAKVLLVNRVQLVYKANTNTETMETLQTLQSVKATFNNIQQQLLLCKSLITNH